MGVAIQQEAERVGFLFPLSLAAEGGFSAVVGACTAMSPIASSLSTRP